MPKAKKVTVVSKCQCDVCGQIAHVVTGAQHHHCHGIKLLPGKNLPAAFSGLTQPGKKGTWQTYVAPALHIAMDEPVALLPTGT